jgi:hypothetical protein
MIMAMPETYELSLAALSKPFPWGPLAAALSLNDTAKYPLITITTEQGSLLQSTGAQSSAKLVRKSEYFTHSKANLVE